MAIRYKSEEQDGYLLVRSTGAPDSAEEMFAYIQQVYAEVVDRGYEKFLVDESNTSIHFDIHKSAVDAQPANTTKDQRESMRVAVVCASHSLPLYKHLQTLADASGLFRSKVFDDLGVATQWIEKD